MRNDTGNIFDRETGLIERFLRGAEHGGDRLFVNLLAGHVDGRRGSDRRYPW